MSSFQDFPKPAIELFPAPPSGEKEHFSILIPTWNNLDLLQLCIRSIRENSAFKHQIIVHVNEGTDGSLDWVRSEGIDYSWSSQNAGVCYSVNAMARLARTDLLLYLNDDMYVCQDWDRVLLETARSIPHRLWYLSGTMIEPVQSRSACVVSPHDFGRDPHHFLRQDLDAFAARVQKSDWYGASWPPSLVPAELFEKVGGYSEEFSPGMYSDPDFSMKLWKAGVRDFRGLGKSLVYHFQSRSTGKVRKNNGRKQFARKWGLPASYFYREWLRLGQAWSAEKLMERMDLAYFLARLKSFWIGFR
jgi:GT2 family glycosyltransferase